MDIDPSHTDTPNYVPPVSVQFKQKDFFIIIFLPPRTGTGTAMIVPPSVWPRLTLIAEPLPHIFPWSFVVQPPSGLSAYVMVRVVWCWPYTHLLPIDQNKSQYPSEQRVQHTDG